MQRAESGILPEVRAEICGYCLCVPSQQDSKDDQAQQCRDFGGSENILNERAGLDAEDVDDREDHDDEDGGEILGIQADIHAAEDHRADGEHRHFPEMQYPVSGGDCGPEDSEELPERDADYLAIGPVFATTSKANPDPVVGLDGVRRARELTRKPLVAIGGITRNNVRSVIEAGADSVAVISDLIRDPRKSAEAFFEVLR